MESGINYLSTMQEATGRYFNKETASAEFDFKTKRVCERFSENLHLIANEPSLALFRIQEHVRKSLPLMVDKRREVDAIQQDIQGSCFDTEYAINAVKSMEKSKTHFQNIQDLMKNAMFMKQQLDYEHSRKKLTPELKK